MSNDCTFKPRTSRKLIKQLKRHSSVKDVLEVTGFSLKDILQNSCLGVPEEYVPGSGWSMIWKAEKLDVKIEWVDLLQTVLKFAWSYSTDAKNEIVYSGITRELAMLDAGSELKKVHLQKVKAGGADKHWKALRKWIKRKLSMKRKWTHQELWDALPESYDDEKFYLADDRICLKGKYNSKGKPSSIGFRAFEDNIRAVKKTLVK